MKATLSFHIRYMKFTLPQDLRLVRLHHKLSFVGFMYPIPGFMYPIPYVGLVYLPIFGWSFMANLRKYTVLPMDASWVYGSFCSILRRPQGAASHGRYVGLVGKAELRHRADADGEHDSQSKPHTTGTEHEAYHRCIVGRIFSCNLPHPESVV